MAGKRHHHIWQMLQCGFAEKRHGDDHVWVYSKNQKPRQTVTRKYGVQKGFYGEEGSLADTNITAFENSVQSYLQDVRSAPNDRSLDVEICAPLVAHLEMRGQFLRHESSYVVSKLTRRLLEVISDERNAIRIFRAYIEKHPEQLEQILDEKGFGQAERPAIHAALAQLLPELLRQGARDFIHVAKPILNTIEEQIPRIAKNAHNKSLENDFSELGRTEKHKALNFWKRAFPEDTLILPDTCIAFMHRDRCSPISQKSDDIDAIVIPLSPSVAIIGSPVEGFHREHRTIRRVLASCAYHEFVAMGFDNELQRLSSRIGTNAKLISDAEIERMVNLNDLLDL